MLSIRATHHASLPRRSADAGDSVLSQHDPEKRHRRNACRTCCTSVYKIPPTTIRPQARHKGELTTRIKAAFTTEASARMAAENGLGQMFVAGAGLDEMTAQVRRFNTIRAEMGLPPDQPTTLLWMYCAETASEAEEGWEYFHHQLLAAQHHYFEWNNPGYAGIPGYEEYLKRQTADVGVADAGLAARRATQPIGTPDEIIEKIRTLQHAISLE
ncbi:MAG: LLM class flavin-dependent oxidoreductase, partial [Candidatus Rokuibacteriota bacterium]